MLIIQLWNAIFLQSGGLVTRLMDYCYWRNSIDQFTVKQLHNPIITEVFRLFVQNKFKKLAHAPKHGLWKQSF